MNALASQCSSGCESGWTLYLEHSFQLNHNAPSHTSSQFIGEDNDEYKDKKAKKEEVEEEDLSMVSDASSGPPHFPDAQDNGSFYSASKAAKLGKRSKKRQKVKEYQQLPSFLDDTASSPVFDLSMNNVTVTNQQTSNESMLDYSHGFSATYYEERSSSQEHFGFLEPSLSENGVENNYLCYSTCAVEDTEDPWRAESLMMQKEADLKRDSVPLFSFIVYFSYTASNVKYFDVDPGRRKFNSWSTVPPTGHVDRQTGPVCERCNDIKPITATHQENLGVQSTPVIYYPGQDSSKRTKLPASRTYKPDLQLSLKE
ncbi:unnamed protein product [Sphenostylis stenocarpa]|uniref:Uncharacterized protein n=1 Tax=Sphenostylis stenocarpa TaxID=92480 RepID=A0AA86S5L7_9FABA|nr:unnamed protein product [Sphenostylis stenocarpa]